MKEQTILKLYVWSQASDALKDLEKWMERDLDKVRPAGS